MTTSTKSKNLTELFEDPNGFISTPRSVTKISESFTKVSSFVLINKMFDFFTRKGKEFAVFSLPELAKLCKKSESTVREALKETKEKGALIVEDVPNIGKLIMINKPKNKKFYKDFLEGKETLYIARKNKTGGSVDATPPTEGQEGQVVNSVVEFQSTLPLNEVKSIDNKELCQSPIDPIYIDPNIIDHHHIEEALNQNLKTSSENLKQKSNNDDDDFLKNFDKEEEEKVNPIIEVLEEKNDKVDPSEQKTLQTDKPDLTHTQKSSGVAGANCGQNVDKAKDELYKKILNIGVKEKEAKELIQIVKSEILEEYLLAVPYWKKAGNIKNMGAFFNTVVRNPKPEQLPKEFLLEKKQDEKKKEVNKFKEFCKNLGLAETLGMKELKSYISSCKNIFTNKDELAEKTFEQNFNSLVGALGSTEAEKIANQSVRTTLNKLDGNRRLLEKTLDYLKINTEITKFNYINLINKALNKIEIQFAGAI